MLDNEKLLFDELYEKTKDCGRVPFVKLLMTKEKENQELKLELSGYRQAILEDKDMLGLKEENDKLKKKYENAVADYETTMAEKEQLNSLVNSCQEEIRQLKKQLEEYKKELETWKKKYGEQ